MAVHAGGGAGTLGRAGGGGGPAQDARQRQGQRQAGAHGGAGPCPPGGHGVQGPAPGGGCRGGARRGEPGEARGNTDGLGSGRRSWRGGGASSALRRTGRGRSGARRAAATAAAPSAGPTLPRCASLGVPRCRAPPGPAGPRPGVQTGSGIWGSAVGHCARGGPPWAGLGGGWGTGRPGELAGRCSLSPFTEQGRHQRRGAHPCRPPLKKRQLRLPLAAPRVMSTKLGTLLERPKPGGRRQQRREKEAKGKEKGLGQQGRRSETPSPRMNQAGSTFSLIWHRARHSAHNLSFGPNAVAQEGI